MKSGFVLCFALVAALVASSCGAIVYVDKDAPGPTHDGASWDTAFLTIQEGVSAAAPGGEVWVANGLYVENVVMGENVSVYGGFLGAEVGGYEEFRDQRNYLVNAVVIDGNGAPDSTVVLAGGSVVDGFTVTGGSGRDLDEVLEGGGFLCFCVGSPVAVANNTIVGNTADTGAGIACHGSTLALTNNTFSGNTAMNGGGAIYCVGSTLDITAGSMTGNTAVFGSGGIRGSDESVITVADCAITANPGTAGGVNWTNGGAITVVRTDVFSNGGGGILAYGGCSVALTDSTVAVNTGPGVVMQGPGGDLLMTGSTVAANAGGGLYLDHVGSVCIVDSEVPSNGPAEIGGVYIVAAPTVITGSLIPGNNITGGDGGGVYAVDSAVAITCSQLHANGAMDGSGGAMAFGNCTVLAAHNLAHGNRAGFGGGMYCHNSVVMLDGNTLFGNQAPYDGGAILCERSSLCAVNNTLGYGAAGSGGGIAVLSCDSVDLINNTIARNSADDGGGVYLYDCDATLVNSIVASNTAQVSGGGIFALSATTSIDYCDLWNNSPDDYSGCAPGPNDISVDPQFVGPDSSDFHLLWTSPCIDVGTNAAPGLPYRDIDDDPRVCDGDNDAVAVVDMGSDEYREEYESNSCPDEWFVPGWVWFSIPLAPHYSSDASDILGFNCTNKVFAWDDDRRTVILYPDDFTDLAVGLSYVARLEVGEQYVPVYEGSQPALPFERLMPSAGWSWVGVPSTQDIYMLDLCVSKDGFVRTPVEDAGAADPLINWNWIYWDPIARAARIVYPFGGGDDEWLHPWYGYRVWANTEDVTIVFP